MTPWTLARLITALLVAVVAIGLSPTSTGAQQFGRNKMQYRTFEFQVLRTAHFDVHFYPEEQAAAVDVGRMAERWHARLTRLLGHELRGRQPIILYASPADFRQTNVIADEISEATGGVTEGLKRRVVLPLAGTLAETDHVLGHELVHAFQYDIADRREEEGLNDWSFASLPLWFVEGMAEYLSVGPVDAHTGLWLRDALQRSALPAIDRLDHPDYFPYRWGQALWAYIGGRWGDLAVGDVFRSALRVGVSTAFARVLDTDTETLTTDWHEAIERRYAGAIEAGRRPDEYGPVVGRQGPRDRALYGSPALSPDGRQIVFFSERDLLSVDLYLAHVDSGQVIRKLLETAVDPHFSSLQFIGSAGAWRPDGTDLAMAAVRNGLPALAILDTRTGAVRRERIFAGLGEILNPTWSPDGQRIALSATSGGHSDLFVYDLGEDTLHQITDDAFADLQPAWSPDGETLVFVTDRFTTDLTHLAGGAYRLALVAPDGSDLRPLPTFEQGKSVNPQWSADGRHVRFLSDRDGVTNIYTLALDSGAVSRLTRLDTGISGVTALSPALSASSGSDRLAFTTFEAGRLAIHVTAAGSPLEAEPVDDTAVRAAMLPPADRTGSLVVDLLADATTGLPVTSGEARPYRPRLSLDWIGQPYLTAAATQFGASFGGGVSFLWSDMLGNHSLGSVVDVSVGSGRFGGLLDNAGGIVQYQNLARQWDWSITAEQSPYLARGFASGRVTVGQEPAILEQDILQRQTYRGVSAYVARPFNAVRRLELGVMYERASFAEEIRTRAFSLVSGQTLLDETTTSSPYEPLNLTSGRAALVFDNSVFGATSPIAGGRSRLEVAPTFGSIRYTSVLADYRRYLMPVRFYTIAGRLLHFGRYGTGSDDPRLLPLFIGYPELLRGYGIGSFDATECTSTPASSCVEIDRLFGTRMLIGNAEFRFPLLRPFGVATSMYGPVPIEVALFADGGVAWIQNERPAFVGGSREGVASVGVTFRINLFGWAVAQVDLAHPVQRPERTWVWEFSLNPGF